MQDAHTNRCCPTCACSPTPLRVGKIGPILASASGITPFRSIGAARLMRERWVARRRRGRSTRVAVQASRPLTSAAPTPRGAPKPHTPPTPRHASPPLSPRGEKPGAGVTKVERP